jgi:septum formation protein
MKRCIQLDRPLILASVSPRRRLLLRRMGFSFSARAPQVKSEEAILSKAGLAVSLKNLAAEKAMSVAMRHKNSLVFGADTVVVVDGRILGKPASRADGRAMLRALSGRSHAVFTGTALICVNSGFAEKSVTKTTVFFRPLSTAEIERYLDTGEYRDKAGAYGIQGAAMALVDRIHGCFYNVVGLPVTATIALFEQYRARKETCDI